MTKEEVLQLAEKYNLTAEIKDCLNSGMTPDEAALEWDL